MAQTNHNRPILDIRDLHVSVGDNEILRGMDLSVSLGEVHAIMGPNGSGKSTFTNVVAGRPGYRITSGEIIYEGESILGMFLDETDSGLDIDALKVVSRGVNEVRGPDKAIVLVTHYQRILNFIKPDYVHVLIDGRIVRSGGSGLAQELEAQGYEWLREPAEAEAESVGATGRPS